MAYVVAVANNKGGTGKTTTALHLADGWARQGHRVLLVDADQQASSSDWRNNRESEIPFQLVAMSKPVIHKELPRLAENYDYVVIDCPPGGPGTNGEMTRSAVMISHLVVIPVKPSGLDFWAANPMITVLNEIAIFRPDLQARILINHKATNTKLGRMAREGAEAFMIPVLKTEIPYLQEITLATTKGETVFTARGSGHAVALYQRLLEELEAIQSQPAAQSETAVR